MIAALSASLALAAAACSSGGDGGEEEIPAEPAPASTDTQARAPSNASLATVAPPPEDQKLEIARPPIGLTGILSITGDCVVLMPPPDAVDPIEATLVWFADTVSIDAATGELTYTWYGQEPVVLRSGDEIVVAGTRTMRLDVDWVAEPDLSCPDPLIPVLNGLHPPIPR